MEKTRTFIAKELYEEIIKAQKSLQIVEDKKNTGKKKNKITFLKASQEIGKYLNTLRNRNI